MKLTELVAVHCGKGWRLSKGLGANILPPDHKYLSDGCIAVLRSALVVKAPAREDKHANTKRNAEFMDALVSEVWSHPPTDRAHCVAVGSIGICGVSYRAAQFADGIGESVFSLDRLSAIVKATGADGLALCGKLSSDRKAVLYRGLDAVGFLSPYLYRQGVFTPDGADTLPTPKPAIPDRVRAVDVAAVARVEESACLPDVEPFIERTGTSGKGRVWVALTPTYHLTRDRYLATLAGVKAIGGWWSVGYPGQKGAFAAWADRRAELERVVLAAAS